jgi:hypothetical protein
MDASKPFISFSEKADNKNVVVYKYIEANPLNNQYRTNVGRASILSCT